MAQALKNAQTSLYLWTIVSLMTLALSTFIALNQAAKWKEQIADLLNTIYRLSAGGTPEKNTATTDDELGYLAKVLSENIMLAVSPMFIFVEKYWKVFDKLLNPTLHHFAPMWCAL